MARVHQLDGRCRIRRSYGVGAKNENRRKTGHSTPDLTPNG
jgi:hypothetical protein